MATTEQLIKALRCEPDCCDCAYYKTTGCDTWGMRCDAADALEAAEDRISELEKQLPNDGEWIPNSPFTGKCSNCGSSGNLRDKYCSKCGWRLKVRY